MNSFNSNASDSGHLDQDIALQEKVIEQLEAQIREIDQSFEVYSNPGDAETFELQSELSQSLFPDLFVQNGSQILAIYAVETPKSMTRDVVDKWQRYSDLPMPFWIVVPKESTEKAELILNEHHIECDNIVHYEPRNA